MQSGRRAAQIGLAGAAMVLILSMGALLARTARPETTMLVSLGSTVPDFQLPDLNGNPLRLSSLRGKIIVLFFANPHDPASIQYGSRINDLARQLENGRVQFLAINTKLDENDIAILRVQAKIVGRPFPTLIDSEGWLARAMQVSCTPTILVINSDGELQYRGAFDDNENPQAVRRQYCAEVVRALLAGEPVVAAQTQTFGYALK